MANPITLAFGLLLGFLFVGFMVFKVLPQLDHVVKKEKGPIHAAACTRFCALCIAMPFYVFTIWMTVVILAHKDRGISVLQDVCGEDYGCANSFAFGKTHFNKDACTSPDCGTKHLYARSGSKFLSLHSLGLGQDLQPSEETVDFECNNFSSDDVCLEAVGGGETCECTTVVQSNGRFICGQYIGCQNDIDDQIRTETCTVTSNGLCTSWLASTDSSKQFSFWNCSCTTDDCLQFSCDIFTMEYFYPNIFYAGCATILFIFPAMIVTYVILKTQLRKIFKCNEMGVYVYSQEAGMQEAYVAENLATGGFYQDQDQKTKYRTLGKKDVLGFFLGLTVILFFSWIVVLVSGRVGLSFICLAAVLIAIVELYKLYTLITTSKDHTKEKMSTNNPMAERAAF